MACVQDIVFFNQDDSTKATFMSVMIDIPLVVTDNRKNEANEVKEILEICRDYISLPPKAILSRPL
jgi:hypothetical protein